MKLKRNFNLTNSRLTTGRRGATAVEFAIVCPIVLAIMFGMLEISRISTIIDSARTSVITGAREARVASATRETIRAEMEETLTLFGIRESTIEVTPATIDPTVSEISINIEVPFSASNGLYLITLAGSDNNLNFDIMINR